MINADYKKQEVRFYADQRPLVSDQGQDLGQFVHFAGRVPVLFSLLAVTDVHSNIGVEVRGSGWFRTTSGLHV